MQKNLDENSYEKRIENIEKGKSYLKSNGFFKSKSNLFEDIQKFIYKREFKKIFYFWLIKSLNKPAIRSKKERLEKDRRKKRMGQFSITKLIQIILK